MDALPELPTIIKTYGGTRLIEPEIKHLGDRPGLSADTIQKAITEIDREKNSEQKKGLFGLLLFRIAVLGVAKGVDAKLPILNIVKLGANRNIKNKQGVTPLIIASMKGNVEIVEALLNLDDVDLDITDINGKTAHDYAFENRNFAKENSPEQERYQQILHMISEKADPLPPNNSSVSSNNFSDPYSTNFNKSYAQVQAILKSRPTPPPSSSNNLRRGGSRKRKSRRNRSRKLRR
jgi:hypothetical protein